MTLLGLTHYWTKSHQGVLGDQTPFTKKRLRRTKQSLWRWCRINRHAPLQYQYQQLYQKVRGYFQYFGLRGNIKMLEDIECRFVEKAWRYWLSQSSNESSIGWAKFEQLMQTYVLPTPRIVHNI